MGRVWVWNRTQWRRRGSGALASTLLFALTVAVVLAATAGARRTQTAYPRMVEAVDASDVLANPDLGADTGLDFDAVKALPGVDLVGVAAGMFVVPPDAEGNPDFTAPILSVAPTGDDTFGYRLDRPLLSEGELPDLDAADQIVIDPVLADKLGVSAGDRTELLVPDLSAPPVDGQLPPFDPVTFTVTGVGRSTSQILTDETFDISQILLTSAFFEANRDAVGFWGLGVRLDDPSPAGVAAFRDAVDGMVPSEGIEYRSQSVDNDAVRRAVEPQVIALYAFGVLVGLAALVLVAQSLSRALVLHEEEARTLHAVGLTRRALFVGGMSRVVVIGVTGALVGVMLAIAASSRFPIGFVRRAEPHPGIQANVAVLAGGAAIAVLLLLIVLALPLWRGSGMASRATADTRPSVAATALRRWGAGPALVSGVHFALEPPSGHSATRTRLSLVGGIVVVTILSAAATIGASLGHLVDTPRLYGWNWDAGIEINGHVATLESALDADPEVSSWSRITLNRLMLDGVAVPTVGVEPDAEAVTPTVVEGQAPTEADQIALGGRTLKRLDVALGDTVPVRSPDGRTQDLLVVGRAVFPGLGTYSGSERTELGTGAMTTVATLRRFGPPVEKGVVAIRLEPSADRAEFQRHYESLLIDAGQSRDEVAIATAPRRPSDIVALGRVRRAPAILAGVVAALIVVQLVMALFTVSRGRRHDLALLKTVGFVRRQVAATVSWQTSTVATVALVAGLPLGVALGRALWTALGDRLGVVPDPVTPLALLALLAGATVIVAVTVSFAGGALAARAAPATVLRSE